MRVHRSALKHGLWLDTIQKVYDHPVVIVDLDPDSDPPKILIIGLSPDGNLTELIALILADDDLLIIHAMRLRPIFHRFLPDPTERPDDKT